MKIYRTKIEHDIQKLATGTLKISACFSYNGTEIDYDHVRVYYQLKLREVKDGKFHDVIEEVDVDDEMVYDFYVNEFMEELTDKFMSWLDDMTYDIERLDEYYRLSAGGLR